MEKQLFTDVDLPLGTKVKSILPIALTKDINIPIGSVGTVIQEAEWAGGVRFGPLVEWETGFYNVVAEEIEVI